MKLSKNFSLKEFTKSQTAERRGIDNSPTEEHTANIQALVDNVLQPLRDKYGPVNLSSGYRSEELNDAIGGSKRSQHSKGQAADFEIAGMDNATLAKAICDSDLDFDQLILEFYTEGVPDSGWIHLSYNASGQNRRSVLTAVRQDGKLYYISGLVV